MPHTKRLLALSTMFISAAVAQQQPADMKDLQSVYVRDSGVASEKIALAERMERLKEWDKSADVYQEIIEKYADRVVPTRSDETGQISQYNSVALVVQEKLAKWPEEGLQVYRGRYEQSAKDMLDRAGNDRQELQKVFSQYFPTDSAKQAGLRLLGISFERGEFASAAWVGKRLLSFHPSLVAERPATLFHTALAEHLSGNAIAAAARLDELKQKYPQAIAQVRGKDVNLVEALTFELANQPSMVKAFRSDSWPMAFGNLEASALPQQTSFGGARMFSIEIPKSEPSRNMNPYQRQMMMRGQTGDQRKLGAMTGILPVADQDDLFFQDNARIYAISLTSGLALPGWIQTHPGGKKGTYSVSSAETTPAGKPLGLSVTDRFVVSVLGQTNSMRNMFMGNQNQQGEQSQLVCLDRVTGKAVWTTTLQKIKLPDELGNLRNGQFCGIPLVVEDTIYVPVRADRGGQFEECHLVAIRLRDGEFQWGSYVASSAANMMIDQETGMATGSFNPMLSYSDGRVYVSTNLGALACLDASDGKTLWLNIYARNVAKNQGPRFQQQFIGGRNAVRKPFTQDPPMIVDGLLFASPSDAKEILVYDAASGEEVKRIPRELERPRHDAIDTLLAVVGDQMILANRSTVFAIPWKTFDPKKSVIANGGKFRTFDHGGGSKEEEAIRGRPFVSADKLYIPIASKLHRMSIKQWLIEDSYPQNGVWDDAEESPGNVLVTPDHVIIAGSDRVTVYADLAVATKKLDELIAKDPAAVEPYLRYGELFLAGGKSRDAIGWLDQAIERMSPDDAKNLPRGASRDRLFEITCGFASKLQRTEAATPEVIRQLFARARLAADSDEQQVRYRMAHAAALQKFGEPENEVAIYQEILANADWRTMPVSGKSGSSTAATEAENAITALVTKQPDLYAPYETASAAAYQTLAGKADANPNDYLAIAEQWPLSTQAISALQKAAGAYEKSDQNRLANQTLRRLLKRSKENSLKVQTLEGLARSYMQLPNQVDLAIVRLEQAKTIDPQHKLTEPIILSADEKIENVTLTDAIGILNAYRSRLASSALPKLGLPSSDEEQVKEPFKPAESLANIQSIVPQQEVGRRADRVVTLDTDNAITQIKAGTLTPLHEPIKLDDKPLKADDILGSAFSGDTLIVVANRSLIAIANGKALWRAPLSGLPNADASGDVVAEADEKKPRNENDIDGDVAVIQNGVQIRAIGGRIIRGGFNPNGGQANNDGPERISHFQVLSDRVVVATSEGRVISFDLTTGKPAWQVKPAELPVRHFQAIDDFVVISSTDQFANTDVFVLDAITGQINSKVNFNPQQNRQLMNLALSRDGVLVTTQMNELNGRDLFDPSNAGWKRQVGNRQIGEMPFINVVGEDQLIINNDRILAVSMAQDQQKQSVRVFDLRTGEPKRSKDPRNGKTVETIYTSGSTRGPRGDQSLSIQTVGSQVYLVSPNAMKSINLDAAGSWSPNGINERGPIKGFELSRDYALVIQTPAQNDRMPKLPSIQISTHSREKLDTGDESGLLVYRPTIKDPAGILADEWTVADGGFYYVSGDQKLKLLKANH